jgi:hypothetical protein
VEGSGGWGPEHGIVSVIAIYRQPCSERIRIER